MEILTMFQSCRYHPHFIDEEVEFRSLKKKKKLAKVTPMLSANVTTDCKPTGPMCEPYMPWQEKPILATVKSNKTLPGRPNVRSILLPQKLNSLEEASLPRPGLESFCVLQKQILLQHTPTKQDIWKLTTGALWSPIRPNLHTTLTISRDRDKHTSPPSTPGMFQAPQ